VAAEHPTSIFAPKALVAALALDAPQHDSIVRVLDSRYAASPYTLALHGDPSPAYAAAEESLAVALGLDVGRDLAAAPRWAPPVPGPRGPPLDAPPVAAPEAPRVRAPRPAAPRGPARPRDGRPF
jgi:hypothetical protein